MPVCVDANLPLAFLLLDPNAESARRLWNFWLTTRVTMVAPSLFAAETTSIVRERVYRRDITEEEGRTALEESATWPVNLWAGPGILQPLALQFATRFAWPKAYDAQYLAVAQLLGCELWTADRRLYNRVKDHLPWVRWVEEEPG